MVTSSLPYPPPSLLKGRNLSIPAAATNGNLRPACELEVRELNGQDLDNGFLETLANLAEVNLTADQAREVLRQRLRRDVHTYVACQDGRVVGTISLLVEYKFIHGGGRCGHIEDVVVHRECQNRGIAQVLVRHAVSEARRLGCYKVILSCYESLMPFYKRCGFRTHDCGMRLDVPGTADA
jgi:glucosamine-phosphate N-acetyltransferase